MEMFLSEHGYVEPDCIPTIQWACRISKTVPFIAIVFSDEILGTLIDTVCAVCALLPLRLQHSKDRLVMVISHTLESTSTRSSVCWGKTQASLTGKRKRCAACLQPGRCSGKS